MQEKTVEHHALSPVTPEKRSIYPTQILNQNATRGYLKELEDAVNRLAPKEGAKGRRQRKAPKEGAKGRRMRISGLM